MPTTPHTSAPPVAFVFTGQGSEYWSMGKVLFATSATFRTVMRDCSSRLSAFPEWQGASLEEETAAGLVPAP